MLEKGSLELGGQLLVSPQRLRSRKDEVSPTILRAKTTKSLLKYVSLNSFDKSKEDKKVQVNWIKHNILVSIYDNWIRIGYLIAHLIDKSCHCSLTPFMIEPVNTNIKNKPQTDQNRSQMIKEYQQLLFQFQNRRTNELNNKIKNTQIDTNKQALLFHRMAYLSKQLISTIPAQSKMWSKIRIQNHSKMIEEFMNNQNQSKLPLNSNFIIQSLNDRLRLIEDVQETFLNSNDKSKSKLEEKLNLLKMPFNKLTKNHLKKGKLREKFADIVRSIQSKNQKILQRPSHPFNVKRQDKPLERHTISQIRNRSSSLFRQSQKGTSNHLISSKKFIPTKQSAFKKKQSVFMKNSVVKMDLRGIQHTQESFSSSSSSKSIIQVPKKQNRSPGNKMIQRKAKILNKESFQSLNQPKQKKKLLNKTSFQDDLPKNKKSNQARGSVISNSSLQRNDSFIKRPSDQMISIQEIDQFEQQNRFSHHKSHKKLGTSKHIALGGRRGGPPKTRFSRGMKMTQNVDKAFTSGGGEKLIKKKKNHIENRKGNMTRVNPHIKFMQLDGGIQQFSGDGTPCKNQLISYLRGVRDKGLLDGQKYEDLRDKLNDLLKYCSASEVEKNKKYAQQISQKLKNRDLYLLRDGSLDNRLQLLKNLHQTISDDERIKIKIQNEWDSLLDYKARQRNNLPHNQQLMLTSLQEGTLPEQKSRRRQFDEESKHIKFGQELLKALTDLKQIQI